MSAGPLSHRRWWRPEVVQSVSPPDVHDLGPGYLDPDLLPVDLLRDGYARALAEYGSAALSYGADQGTVLLRRELAERITAADGVVCGPEQVLVTAGTSSALQLLTTTTTVAGQTVFVERTSYDFARRIFADHGLRLCEVADDGGGMDPRALRDAIARADRPGFVYLTPTFHNPTGRLVGVERRRELLAAAGSVLVVEDDAYADLHLSGDVPPASLAGLSGYRGVVRLGTFSKTLGPGLRLGWLAADAATVAGLAGRGVFVSGGSANHVTSLAVAELVRGGEFDRHLVWLRERLRERRDALLAAVRVFGRCVEVDPPGGGFFCWLRFPDHPEADVLAAAERAGVRVAAGSRFGSVERAVRLAYSFTPPDRLVAAVSALAAQLSLSDRPTGSLA